MVARDGLDDTLLHSPMEFEPFLRSQVWGGDAFYRLFGKGNSSGLIGESWEVCGLPQNPSVTTGGALAGQQLPTLWRDRFTELVGVEADPGVNGGGTFPLLVKWLDCRGLLSVQVHPNDALAAELLNESCGKTEAWVVVEAEPTARIYAGLKQGVSEAELVKRLRDGTVEECLHSFVPKVGDCISLPAGTIHAAGGGIVFAEVQQSSDATFRLFDWNRVGLDGRRRALHQDQALRCLTWPQNPVNPVTPASIPECAGTGGESLLKTAYFELDRFRVKDAWRLPYAGEMSIWMVLDGVAVLSAGATSRILKRGATILLPAGVSDASWAAEDPENPCQLLAIRLPSVRS